ncbi:MAG: hypothetical protein AB1589_07090 [Cyanobacteriota bacterium]
MPACIALSKPALDSPNWEAVALAHMLEIYNIQDFFKIDCVIESAEAAMETLQQALP